MKVRGILVASAALALLAGAPAVFAAEGDGGTVKCQGVNSCAGKGQCGAVDGSHDCSGKNSCKGKGWIEVESAEQCTKMGGTVVQ